MKTVNVYEEGETVLIKAKIARVIFDKDKITYELKEYGNDHRYSTRFTEKEITPYKGEEEEEDEGKN